MGLRIANHLLDQSVCQSETLSSSQIVFITLLFVGLSQGTADVCNYAEPNRHVLTFFRPILLCTSYTAPLEMLFRSKHDIPLLFSRKGIDGYRVPSMGQLSSSIQRKFTKTFLQNVNYKKDILFCRLNLGVSSYLSPLQLTKFLLRGQAPLKILHYERP